MPRTCIDTADATKLTETLQLIAGWLAADPATLAPSLLTYIGHPAYGLDALRNDPDRRRQRRRVPPRRRPGLTRNRAPPEFPMDIPLTSAAVAGCPELRADLCLGTHEPSAALV